MGSSKAALQAAYGGNVAIPAPMLPLPHSFEVQIGERMIIGALTDDDSQVRSMSTLFCD